MSCRISSITPSRLPKRRQGLTIQSNGTRMSSAHDNTGKGRYLDEYLGPQMASIVMPVYRLRRPQASGPYHLQYRRHLRADRRWRAAAAAVRGRRRDHPHHRVATTISEEGGFEINT